MPINLCSFEPGDGTVYRVLVGQVRQYTIFGFAEGSDALIPCALPGLFTEHRFLNHYRTAKHTNLAGDADYVEQCAWATYAALTGQAVAVPSEWAVDWRERLMGAEVMMVMDQYPGLSLL
jgi:hypothetical protein